MTTKHRFLTNEEWFNHFQDTLPLEVRERFESLLNKASEEATANSAEIRRLEDDLDSAWTEVSSLEQELREAENTIDELQQKLDELGKVNED